MNNIKLDIQAHIAVVTIDHPPANAWNLATMAEFEGVIQDLENDGEVRVLILIGAGEKCFSAGFDVKDAANTAEISAKGRALWRRLDRFPKPVIAAINGHAFGGGLELALACHFRIMGDDPTFTLGLTELNLGIIPGWGGTQRLTRIVGRSRSLDMILFSRRIDFQEAHALGLVDKIVPANELLDSAKAMASALAERPPIAVSCVLKAISTGIYDGMDAGLDMEAKGSAIVRQTEDRQEGFKAFVERRKPVFKGR